MKNLIKQTFVYNIDNEEEAAQVVAEFKDKQIVEGFTVLSSKVDYKTKKAKGEIIDEKWVTQITVAYDVD